jgi:NADPH2:quinone reductase
VFGAGQGSYADKIAVSWQSLLPIPKNLTFSQASGLFVTWPTSYEALTGRAQLKAGKQMIRAMFFLSSCFDFLEKGNGV